MRSSRRRRQARSGQLPGIVGSPTPARARGTRRSRTVPVCVIPPVLVDTRAIPKSTTFSESRPSKKEVRRLDVSMDDAVAVRGVERFGRLRKPGERLVWVDAAAPGADGQCPAREMLHDRERTALVLAATSKIVTTCGSPESRAAVSASRRKRTRRSGPPTIAPQGA